MNISVTVRCLLVAFSLSIVACNDVIQKNEAQSILGKYRSGMLAIELVDNSNYRVLSLEPNTDGISQSELMTKNLNDLPTKDSVVETGTYTSDGKWITFSGHYLDFPDHRIEIQGSNLEAYSIEKGDKVVYSKVTP